MNEPHEPYESKGLDRDPGLSRLYREAGDSEPPAALDAAILRAARAAVAENPAPVLPWWKRLRVPAAVAATTLLAVMLSLTMERNPPEVQESAAQRSAPASAPSVVAPAATAQAPAVKGVAESAPSLSKEAPPAAIGRVESKAKADLPMSAVRNEGGASVAPAAPVPPSMEQRQAMPAAKAERSDINQPVGVMSDRARDAAPPAPAPTLEAVAKRAVPRSEAVWLEEIRELRRQGKHDEAARRLEAFRTAYPNYPLPDDLK